MTDLVKISYFIAAIRYHSLISLVISNVGKGLFIYKVCG